MSINTMAGSSYRPGTQRAVVVHILRPSCRFRDRRGRNAGLVARSVARRPPRCPGLSNIGPSAVQFVW